MFRFLILCLVLAPMPAAFAIDEFEVKAPADHEPLNSTRGGKYFVARPLKKQYDALLAELRGLKTDLETNRVPEGEAIPKLKQLKLDLEKLRAEIEKAKVLVAPIKTVVQTVTIEVPLGAEKLVVITGDAITIDTWDGPGIKCVLEKSILAEDEQAAADDFKAITVIHKHGKFPNLVGRTAAEVDADEQKYLATEDGKKLSEKQRISRREFEEQMTQGYQKYQAFQGKEIDTLELTGIHEGNQWVNLKITYDDGGSFGGDWKRQAKLTIFLPPCQAVALRGCQRFLDVRQLRTALLITSDGSQNRDYDGTFAVRNVCGDTFIDDVPVDHVEQIQGNLTLRLTREFGNTGTTHSEGQRTAYVPAAPECVILGVTGDCRGKIGRMNVQLAQMGGQLDLMNEFGDTTLVLEKPLVEKTHRLASFAGHIQLRLPKDVLSNMRLYAITNYGRLQTNATREQLDETNFTTAGQLTKTSETGTLRAWRCLFSRPPGTKKNDPETYFSHSQRPPLAWDNLDRPAGLDLLSRGGVVEVKVD